MISLSIYIYIIYAYLDLPRGVEWMIRGPYTPSLGFKQHPFGRCWYRYLEAIFVFCFWDGSPKKRRLVQLEHWGHNWKLVGLAFELRGDCAKSIGSIQVYQFGVPTGREVTPVLVKTAWCVCWGLFLRRVCWRRG